MLTDSYIDYISKVRRYAARTCQIYSEVLGDFCMFCSLDTGSLMEKDASSLNCAVGKVTDEELLANLIPSRLREYEVWLMDGRDGAGKDAPGGKSDARAGRLDARTVNLHLSVLSGFCRFLLREGHLQANPVRTVRRPKAEKRLPVFYRDASMEHYFERTAHSASEDELVVLESFGPFVGNRSESARTPVEMYERRLRRLIISLLHASGIRRSELIGLNLDSLDAGRQTLRVRGKGDKMREIPLISSVWQEILLYLHSVDSMVGRERTSGEPLLITASGRRLYPAYVDRAVKQELGSDDGITGRRSPHVLRHTLATELLDAGTDLNSIKELLGHASLAATQVYTHNSIEKLKTVYNNAHPRAKKGGSHGD